MDNLVDRPAQRVPLGGPGGQRLFLQAESRSATGWRVWLSP